MCSMSAGLIGAALLPGHSKWSSYKTRCTQRHLAPRTFFQGEHSSSLCHRFNSSLYLLNIFFSGKSIRPPLTLFKKKKELYFSPLILLVSPSCLEDSRGHWDSRLWYGLRTSVMFRGGGTRCSALHGNQMKALSVELNLHSKSPYGADYHTWERERWRKIFCS